MWKGEAFKWKFWTVSILEASRLQRNPGQHGLVNRELVLSKVSMQMLLEGAHGIWYSLLVQRQLLLARLQRLHQAARRDWELLLVVKETSDKWTCLKQICHNKNVHSEVSKEWARKILQYSETRKKAFSRSDVLFLELPKSQTFCLTEYFKTGFIYLFFSWKEKKTLEKHFVEWKILKITIQSYVLMHLTYAKWWDEPKEKKGNKCHCLQGRACTSATCWIKYFGTDSVEEVLVG